MSKTLKFGGVATDEAECIIRLDKQDGLAHVSCSWPEWSRKFSRLFGNPTKYQEADGMVTQAFWTLPLETILVRKGKRSVSPEARKQAGDRLKIARSSSRAPLTQSLQEKNHPTPYKGASPVPVGSEIA